MRGSLLVSCLAFAAHLSGGSVLTVKEEQYPLRAGCSESAEPVATLKRGDPVKVRFSIDSNGKPCYAVSAQTDGKTVQGYVWAEALEGIEQFEQARRGAAAASTQALSMRAVSTQAVSTQALPAISRSDVQALRDQAAVKTGKTNFALAAQLNLAADAIQSGRPAEAEKILSKVEAPRDQRDVALLRAYALLEMHQPDRAMDILERALRENKKDPQLLAAAGRAAYSLDNPRQALDYWRESLALHPDEGLERMCHKLEKEVSADKSAEKTYGMRFLLRYDTAVASPETARGMVGALEEEFSRISNQLGCPADARIITIVQSPAAYYQTTGAAEWSGGQYDGKIRVPLAPGKKIDPGTRRTFAHEVVHACLSNLGRWPAWVQEGMAQKLSGEALRPEQREVLKVLARAGKLPTLEALGNGWGTLNGAQASIAYGISLAAMELFFGKYGELGPRNLTNNPQMLEQITPELDRGLLESLK